MTTAKNLQRQAIRSTKARNTKYRENYQRLRQAGYSSGAAMIARTWSEERLQELLK